MLERQSTRVTFFTLKNRCKRRGTVNTIKTLALGKYYFKILSQSLRCLSIKIP